VQRKLAGSGDGYDDEDDEDGGSIKTTPPCSWVMTEFYTPSEALPPSLRSDSSSSSSSSSSYSASSKKALMLDVTTGRGHLWLNGIDLGRYWNVTRNGGSSGGGNGGTGGDDGRGEYSQRYYHLPPDVLKSADGGGTPNELVMFDAVGGMNLAEVNLVLTWVEPTTAAGNSGGGNGEEEEEGDKDNDLTTMKDEVDFPNACL